MQPVRHMVRQSSLHTLISLDRAEAPFLVQIACQLRLEAAVEYKLIVQPSEEHDVVALDDLSVVTGQPSGDTVIVAYQVEEVHQGLLLLAGDDIFFYRTVIGQCSKETAIVPLPLCVVCYRHFVYNKAKCRARCGRCCVGVFTSHRVNRSDTERPFGTYKKTL